MSWNLPESRSEMKEAFPDFEGTTLQLGDRALIAPGTKPSTERTVPWLSATTPKTSN